MEKKLPLLVIYPTLLVMILDLIFTLAGQSSEYWASFKDINELSPIGYYLLSNPLWFIFSFIVYLAIIFFLLRNFLPQKIGFPTAITFFTIHLLGSSSWIPRLLNRTLSIPLTSEIRWISIVFFIISISVFFSYCYYPYFKNKE